MTTGNAPTIEEMIVFIGQEQMKATHINEVNPNYVAMFHSIGETLKKLAALESQPVPVEPVKRYDFWVGNVDAEMMESETGEYVLATDYDSLLSALQRAQEGSAQFLAMYEDCFRERKQAEERNRRMVELLKEPSKAMIYAGRNAFEPTACTYATGALIVWDAMSAELLKEVEK